MAYRGARHADRDIDGRRIAVAVREKNVSPGGGMSAMWMIFAALWLSLFLGMSVGLGRLTYRARRSGRGVSTGRRYAGSSGRRLPRGWWRYGDLTPLLSCRDI